VSHGSSTFERSRPRVRALFFTTLDRQLPGSPHFPGTLDPAKLPHIALVPTPSSPAPNSLEQYLRCASALLLFNSSAPQFPSSLSKATLPLCSR